MAFWLNDKTNSLSYVDIPQYITYFEKYPDGEVTITRLGIHAEGISSCMVFCG